MLLYSLMNGYSRMNGPLFTGLFVGYSRMKGPLFTGLFVCFITSPFCCVLIIYLYCCHECREQAPSLNPEMELVQDGGTNHGLCVEERYITV